MLYKNLAYGIVDTAPDPATSGTSLVLGSGEGARFPQPSTDGSFYITVFSATADPTPANAEICQVTARSTDTLTIVRAQKSTTARTVIIGDKVIQGIYAEDIVRDGWTEANETWSYASDSTITVPSGAAAIYQKGDRVKFTQTTVKYFVVTVVADTVLTFAVNTDYTVANAAISLNYYSHQANPIGYPSLFNYVPTFTNLSVGNGTLIGQFTVVGRLVYFKINLVFGSTSSVSGAVDFTYPITSVNYPSSATAVSLGTIVMYIAITGIVYGGTIVWSSTTAGSVGVNKADATYTTMAATSSTVPATWNTASVLSIEGQYLMA